MKPLYKCDYCSFTGTENEVREHENTHNSVKEYPINNEKIDALFTTIPTSVVKVVKDEAELKLPTKETYVSGLHVPSYDFREWSDPIYQCPENDCDGGMCKNLTSVCACLPPKYEYRCNKCGHTDYLSQ